MTPADVNSLRVRARAGDPRALTLLGRILLVGGQGIAASPQEAVAYLKEASTRGDGEATALLSVFAAWGVLRPHNIADALDLLQRAAELGWAASQRELRFIAGRDGTNWAELRRQVDVARWTTPPPVRVLRERPSIRVCEGFASAAECDWLIALARNQLQRAQVYRKDAAGFVESANRTNTEANYFVGNSDVVLRLVVSRVAAASGFESRFFEVAKLLHYAPGQQFHAHCDFQEPATPALRREIERHGQRVATVLVYLNDDYAGGETDFPRAGLRFRGARGDALIFSNVLADGSPDYDTLHAGLPPTSGVKWVLSQWIRSRPVS